MYPKSLKGALAEGLPLRANRRGLVPLMSQAEKPTFTYAELLKNRRMGLSYKQIGKKLGIDPSKEEVMTVYSVLNEGLEGDPLGVESIKAPARIQPPTPLWFLFDSELDLVANHAFPTEASVLQGNPQNAIVKKLGEHAGFMLQNYLLVAEVLHEQLSLSFTNHTSSQHETSMCNDLPAKLLHHIYNIEKSVAGAGYQMTAYGGGGKLRCQCGAVKTLRYKWKLQPIPHPSFFWGCVCFNPSEVFRHDKAKPHRHSAYDVLCDNQNHLTEKSIAALSDDLISAVEFWQTTEIDKDSLDEANEYYGGPDDVTPFTSSKSVIAGLRRLSLMFEKVLEKRSGNIHD